MWDLLLFDFFILSVISFQIRLNLVLNMSSNSTKIKKYIILIFKNYDIKCIIHCKVHFSFWVFDFLGVLF
jgi:hypothetical protein